MCITRDTYSYLKTRNNFYEQKLISIFRQHKLIKLIIQQNVTVPGTVAVAGAPPVAINM